MPCNGILTGTPTPTYSPIAPMTPSSQEFIVICGFMPAVSVLFGKDCKPKFVFGKNHRNTIIFNPFPKYLCLAGFGNLSGEIEFWDLENLKSIGTAKVDILLTPVAARHCLGSWFQHL